MKKYIIFLLISLTVGFSGALTSCKTDIPTIDYQHESKYTADFSKLIEAIESQTTTLNEKINLINAALVNINTTLDQKLQLIEAAVNAGVDSYKELAQKLIDSIDAMNATQDEKLQAISDILSSNYASLDQKLADIEAAINAGIGTYKDYSQKLIDAINAMKISQAEKLQLIYDILKSDLASLSQKVADVEAAIKQGFLDNQTAIEALQDAIVAELLNEKQDLNTRLTDLKKALEAIKGSLDNNFNLNAEAIKALTDKLLLTLNDNQTATNTKIDNITKAIEALDGNIAIEYGKLLTLLADLKKAVEDGADYSEIIEAIKAIVIPSPEPEPEPEPEAVDLGLSVKWATFNVGAKSETDSGDYFAWGETKPKEDYSWDTYMWGKYDASAEPDFGMTKYNSKDRLTMLKQEDDAATVNWGSRWRTPTVDEFEELLDNCSWTWVTKKDANGKDVNGYTVTSKKNGKSIFLPATGSSTGKGDGEYANYWSCELKDSKSNCAFVLFFRRDYSDNYWVDWRTRYYDFVVRPVLKPSSER